MEMDITVKIPDGEYCDGCKFLNQYTHQLVNIFGDPTGNMDEGWECKYYNSRLDAQDHGCHIKVKKCFDCNMAANKHNEAWMMIATYVLILMLMNQERGHTDEQRSNPDVCSF